MPAPRLLDKRTVNQELALEKKRQIDTGMALAKKVDVVRETLGEEEKRLDDFRQQNIKRVQIEIDAEIRKRDTILEGNRILQDERMRLSAPIDLTQAWNEVRTGKIELTEWQGRLGTQQIEVLAREEDLKVAGQKLEKLSIEIERKDELAERTLTEAEKRFAQADSALQQAERQAQDILKTAKQRENHLSVREEDATSREGLLSRRETEVDAHEIDLANREQKLKVNQETFLRAQKYITNRNK